MELHIDLRAISMNAAIVRKMCDDAGVVLRATLKSSYSCEQIIQALRGAGVTEFCATHLPTDAPSNVIPRKHLHWLRLLPPTNSFDWVVRNCATSLHSGLETIRCASESAASLGIVHDYIISVDIGDRRDGVIPESFSAFFEAARRYHHRYFGCAGFSVNHTCCELAIPMQSHFETISTMVEPLRRQGELFEYRSVGGSVVLGYHLKGGTLGPYNEIRVGGALIVGEVEYFTGPIQGLTNPFCIQASILEIRNKPMGGRLRRRALVDFGSIHTDVSEAYPDEPNARIVANSGEYTVLDLTDAKDLKVGERIGFRLGYQAMARAMSSTHLRRIFV